MGTCYPQAASQFLRSIADAAVTMLQRIRTSLAESRAFPLTRILPLSFRAIRAVWTCSAKPSA